MDGFLVDGFLDELNRAWNSHDEQALRHFYAPHYQGEDIGMAFDQRGIEGLTRMLANYWSAFPDLTFTEQERIIQGNQVAIVWTAQGTHRGHLMNIPPTHRSVTVQGTSILHIEDGKIVRARYVWDVAGMLRTLGLLPDLSPD